MSSRPNGLTPHPAVIGVSSPAPLADHRYGGPTELGIAPLGYPQVV
jgi:hypothetical protein